MADERGDPLERETLDRLAACRTRKSYIELDLKEAYFFTAPWRQRQLNSMTQPSQTRLLDAPELNTDLAFLLCQDFITEIVNTYMPEAQQWCERGPGMDLPPDVWDSIKDQIKKSDEQIFRAMKASNLYPEITKAFYPDLALGTVAMWIARPHPHTPITVSAVPLRELEINMGPYGEIDDRFVVRYTRNCYVRELVGGDIYDKIKKEVRDGIESNMADRTQIVWGFWRDWNDKTDTVWQHIMLHGNNLIHQSTIKGEGSCPLIVGRFNPSADWPHGQGPMLQALPTFRQVDEMELRRTEAAGRAIAPPIYYPDDSFTAIEQGLEDGMAYPIRPGSEKAVGSIYPPIDFDHSKFSYEEKVRGLRKLFFVDFPEQRGDTPPTASQWLDEIARAQRRIGTPGMPFWREVPAAIFSRFQHLLEVSGAIAPIRVSGRAVATLPRNPAQAAAEQQEVAMAVRAIQILGSAFPEEFKIRVDGEKTMKAFLEKMRVSLLKFRDQKQVEQAVSQIAQLSTSRHIATAPNAQQGPVA